MQNGHIAAIEILPPGLSDEDAIERAKALFRERWKQARYDGLEVWDETRNIYRGPPILD
jgi:hypothetical protein